MMPGCLLCGETDIDGDDHWCDTCGGDRPVHVLLMATANIATRENQELRELRIFCEAWEEFDVEARGREARRCGVHRLREMANLRWVAEAAAGRAKHERASAATWRTRLLLWRDWAAFWLRVEGVTTA